MVAGTVVIIIIALRFSNRSQHNFPKNFPKIRQSKIALSSVISSVMMFSNQGGGGGGGLGAVVGWIGHNRAEPSDNLGIESQKIVFKKKKKLCPCQNP
jgi:hypothetical protein